MKVFVAGATGVLGRRAVPRLVAAGHEVTAIARGAENAVLVRSLGAVPVEVDLFDPDAVRGAVAGHEAVCNLATHIPPLAKSTLPGAWHENDRIRTEGARNLVDAAIAAGAARYVQESIALPYADAGDAWVDEEAPLDRFPGAMSAANAEAEAERFTAAGHTGVVLRFAMFYGAGASHTAAQLRMAKEGVAPVVGAPGTYQTMIHLDDAASAVVAALAAPAGIYNVAEDSPVTRSEQAAAIATALGVSPGWRPPRAAASGIGYLARSLRVSNRRLREATGWAPAFPDAWSGWSQVVAESGAAVGPRPGALRFVRAALAFLALNAATVGFWAALAPRSFFRSFPGVGRHWVNVDGVYNAHLARDVGELSLALLVVTLAALGSRHRALIRTAGVAWVVSALPHLVYHVAHRHLLGTADRLASLGGLAVQVLLGLAVVAVAPPTPAPPAAGPRPATSPATTPAPA